jgi:plasmid stabilization system protein ParE
MADKVRLTNATYEQIDAIVAHIAKDSPTAATRWRVNLFREIESLTLFPLKHGLAPEAERAGTDLRQTSSAYIAFSIEFEAKSLRSTEFATGGADHFAETS